MSTAHKIMFTSGVLPYVCHGCILLAAGRLCSNPNPTCSAAF